jgi:hypothetical protein
MVFTPEDSKWRKLRHRRIYHVLTSHFMREPMLQVAHDDRPSMTTEEAAVYVGCMPATLTTLRSRGGGPPFYRGLAKRVLYRRSDLDRFIEEHRVEVPLRETVLA